MAALILPRRFYSQPHGYAEPADSSITSLLLPAGGSMVEGAVGKPSSVATFGAAPIESSGKFGRAILGAGGGLILNNTAAYSVNAYTATFAVNITAFDTWGGIYAVSNADATGRFGFQRESTSTNLRVYHDNTNFTTITGVSTADFTAGGDLIFTVSFDGIASGSLKMYLNGVLKFSGTHGFTPTAPSSPRLVLLGERAASATAGTDGKVYFGCLHNRQLADAEVFDLHANPWQVFRAKPRVLYFDVAAGGGATLITTSDTLIPGLTEVQASLVTSSTTDTLLPSVTESVSLAVLVAAVDTLTASVTEAQTSLIGADVTDTVLVSVTEALVAFVTSSITDTLTPSITDTSAIGVTLAVSDTATPTVAEVANALAAFAISDTVTPGLTEAQASLVYAAVAEALTLSLGEVQGSLIASSVTDVFTLTVAEAASLLISITATDILAPYLTEATSFVLIDTWVKDGVVVGVWTASGGIVDGWTAADAVTGTWSEEPPFN